jgi:hypothetical protein
LGIDKNRKLFFHQVGDTLAGGLVGRIYRAATALLYPSLFSRFLQPEDI